MIGAQLVLAQTDDAAVELSDLHVYDTGFLIHLCAVTRLPTSRRRFRAMDDCAGEEIMPNEMLRFGIQFGDGSIAANLDTARRMLRPPNGPVTESDGGTGGPTRIDEAFTVLPPPLAGPLRMVCQRPIFGIDETSHEVDGASSAAPPATLGSYGRGTSHYSDRPVVPTFAVTRDKPRWRTTAATGIRI